MTIQAQEESDLNVMIIATAFDGDDMSVLGIELLDMYRNLSAGNACSADTSLITTVPGDMNMNNRNLQLLKAHITVQGEILNEGVITFSCDTAILDFEEETLDVESPSVKYEFKVYPNPTTDDYVNVNGKGIKRIQFINALGQTVKYFETKADRNRILIDNLSSGLYIIRVQDINDRIGTFKLIIK
jgi:hypothetical protein